MPDTFIIGSRLVDKLAELSPLSATFMGIAGYDHLWGDLGQARLDALTEAARAALEEIARLPEPADAADATARRVITEDLELSLEVIGRGEPYRDLNSIHCPVLSVRGVFDLMPTETEAAWENIAARLETIDRPIAGYRSLLEKGREAGSTVARRQVLAVAEECRTHAEDGGFFDRLVSGYAGSALGERLASGAATAKGTFRGFADYLIETYLPDAVNVDPVGRERYSFATRRYLMADIDLEETYLWGWEEVRRLDAEMRSLAADLDPNASFAEVMEMLKTDPGRMAQSTEEYLEIMRSLQTRAVGGLDDYFAMPDEIKPVDVRISPPGGALGAHYTSPSEDLSRPGTVWYSPGDRTTFPLYDEVSTAYHEGFPGHHYQIAMATYLANELTRYHRLVVWYPGYGEGWALYAEQLMGELGFYDKPDYEIGLRVNQIHRACRVAIDIGMHCGFPIPDDAPFRPGEDWTYDAAVEMLETFSHLNPAYARSEVTRYLGWPGQAIAYKVGERIILQLREQFMARPGATLKEFHRRVVGSGPVGLDHLRSLVLAD